jgi:hypothetical protein
MAAAVRAFLMIATGAMCASLLSGCGSDDGDGAAVASDSASPSASASASDSASTDPTPETEEPSATAPPPSWPACADAWVAGADLPAPYDGCAKGATAVPADSTHCSMGALLVTYDGRFWAVPGHVISEANGPLNRDPDYRQARATCTA